MSFVIISAYDALYGPTAISTEDASLHESLAPNSDQPNSDRSSLTLSRRRRKHDKSQKLEKAIRKYEHKLADCNNDSKAEKLREKVEGLCQRIKDRIAINEDTKINYDPYGKSIVFKVEDAPVRVLNKLATMGYCIYPSAGGGGGGHGHHSGEGGFVWTLFKPNYTPQPIYPKLEQLASTD